MKPLPECRLYTFIDAAFLHGRAPADLARQLCDGGSDLIQLRAKNVAIDEVRRMAVEILSVTRKAGVRLVINDHLSIAIELDAESCHLGQEDFFKAGHHQVAELRAGRGVPLIGLSTHSPQDAVRAVAAGADYLGVGPVFPTGTKPEAQAVTLDYVRWAAQHISIPWFAIGGINLNNIDQVLDAGARGVCAVSAILNSPDVAGACRAFRARLEARLRC
jgi:thiamine-phosphate pyrophosphorylase